MQAMYGKSGYDLVLQAAAIQALLWFTLLLFGHEFRRTRWHLSMPSIVDDSILIMAKAGSGVAMFSTGLFMALQDRIISCGWALTVYGLVLRFLIGPATSAIGAGILRLHGDVLKIVIVQSALPQAVTTFIYAKEYGLHADVLSTAIIIGTILSLPVLIGYYVVLDLLP
nr:auxin efflux carrier component 5-like [Ipomoea batatas]